MIGVDVLLREQGGVVTAAQLVALGHTRRQIREGLGGSLRTIRHGWFAAPGAGADVEAAVAAGGCLTCVSVLRLRGAWIPEGLGRVHARRSRSREPASKAGVVWCPVPLAPVRRPIDPLPVAIRSAARCLDDEDLVVVCDSLLHKGLVDQAALREWLPGDRRVERCEPRSESGTESMVRLRLTSAKVRFDVQVQLDGVGRVDFLIGRRLIVEIDSRAHHDSPAAYAEDRRRDRAAVARGYVVLRLTYQDVVHDWPRAWENLRAIVRAGDHLSAVRG